jgi:hypothetical protein
MLAGRLAGRNFCYQRLNFKSAFIAFKINSSGENIKIQFNMPDKSFEIELMKTHTLKDISEYLKEHKFCK